MTADLATLLAAERDRLVDDWARSLGRLFPAFTHRPVHDLTAAGRAVADGLIRYLQTSEPGVLRTLASHDAVVWLGREVEFPEVLRSLMTLREQAGRLLEPQIAGAAAQAQAYARLVAATDLLLVELARAEQHRHWPAPEVGAAAADLEAYLIAETRRALRFRRPLSLLLVQVDGYEESSRIYGSAAAESAASAVSGILVRHTREVDLRIPLEEGTFAALLLETDLRDARWIAERIRTAAETGEGVERALLFDDLTVSIGLAAFPLHADHAAALLAVAQASLVHARRLGGNTVAVIDELRSGEPVL